MKPRSCSTVDFVEKRQIFWTDFSFTAILCKIVLFMKAQKQKRNVISEHESKIFNIYHWKKTILSEKTWDLTISGNKTISHLDYNNFINSNLVVGSRYEGLKIVSGTQRNWFHGLWKLNLKSFFSSEVWFNEEKIIISVIKIYFICTLKEIQRSSSVTMRTEMCCSLSLLFTHTEETRIAKYIQQTNMVVLVKASRIRSQKVKACVEAQSLKNCSRREHIAGNEVGKKRWK